MDDKKRGSRSRSASRVVDRIHDNDSDKLPRTGSAPLPRGQFGSVVSFNLPSFDPSDGSPKEKSQDAFQQEIVRSRSISPSPTGMIGSQHMNVNRSSLTHDRHRRQSGLFSQDDLSIDVSKTASEIQLEVTKRGVLGAAGGDVAVKHHPISIASSSIGSGSLGSAYDLDATRAHRYRPFRRRWRRFRRKYKGCIFALLSSFTSSLGSYFVHELTSGHNMYSPAYCMLWRFAGVLAPGILIVLFYRFFSKEMVFDTVWPPKEKEQLKRFLLSIARAVVDTLAILLNYQAFKYLLQSETSTVLNSKPIVVQLLAHVTLGEEWGVVPIVMSFVAAIGVLVISKPPFLTGDVDERDTNFVTERLPGIALATGSMLLSAIVYCILRYLKDVHYSVFSLFIGSAGVIVGLGLTLSAQQFVWPDTHRDLVYFVSVACLVCCSSIAIVIALQNEEAFVVSLVRSCDVIFSFLWEILLSSKYPDAYSGGGALIIMFCVCTIFFRKYLTHQDPQSKVYKRFKFLTK